MHKRVKILLAYVDEEKIEIVTEVIMFDMPLLLSKSLMKSMGIVLDLGDDQIHWKKKT